MNLNFIPLYRGSPSHRETESSRRTRTPPSSRLQSIAPSPRPHRPRRTGRAALGPAPPGPAAPGERWAALAGTGQPLRPAPACQVELGGAALGVPQSLGRVSLRAKKAGGPAESPVTAGPGRSHIALGFLRGRGERAARQVPKFSLLFFSLPFPPFFYLFFLFVCTPPPLSW